MRDAHKLMMKFLNTLAVMTEHVKYTSSGDANVLWAVQNSPNYFRLSFSFKDAIKTVVFCYGAFINPSVLKTFLCKLLIISR